MPHAPAGFIQREDHSTEDAGQRLKRARERLNLKFRDVEQFSQQIAERHGNQEFAVLISRLSDIENQGTLPSIYRLYSLCCIYRLDLNEVLTWYGVPVDSIAADAGLIHLQKTHAVNLSHENAGEAYLPIALDPGIDLRRTFFLSECVQRWGKLPLALVGGVDVRRFRYAFVGTEDRSMHPTIPAGALLVIDESKRKVQAGGWTCQSERPIYFLEHREAHYCRWCSVRDGIMSLLPDPGSDASVLNFRYPGEIDVVGQVIGVAINLDPEKQPRTRS